MNKVMLVTGTSTGLGVGIAVVAAKAGFAVYATMRNLSKRGQLDAALAEAGVSAKVLALDVETADSVNAAVAEVLKAEGRIDVLVNNAGVGFARTLEQATEADMQWVLNVNVMGVIRAIKAVLPAMRAQGSGRVINISSVGGLVGQPFHEVYCGSKFAVEGITESLATYVTPEFGIHFTAVEPGGIRSEFAAGVMRNIAETGGMIEDAYLPVLQRYMGPAGRRQHLSDGGSGGQGRAGCRPDGQASGPGTHVQLVREPDAVQNQRRPGRYGTAGHGDPRHAGKRNLSATSPTASAPALRPGSHRTPAGSSAPATPPRHTWSARDKAGTSYPPALRAGRS
jgi:NAD(P)-dependent dehydrogenase (short-subunit alcohol dehydrogenase family)